MLQLVLKSLSPPPPKKQRSIWGFLELILMGSMDFDSHTFVSLYASLISGFKCGYPKKKEKEKIMDITCEVINVVCTKCTSTGVTIFSGFYTKHFPLHFL